jgi:hypothetical protein
MMQLQVRLGCRNSSLSSSIRSHLARIDENEHATRSYACLTEGEGILRVIQGVALQIVTGRKKGLGFLADIKSEAVLFLPCKPHFYTLATH